MLVVAKSIKGQEFLYNPKSARRVSKASAKYICSVLNQYGYIFQAIDLFRNTEAA